jgi:hypothetical protein
MLTSLEKLIVGSISQDKCRLLWSVVFLVGPAGRPARPRKQHDYHQDMKVKPEAATAAIELLMMGGKTPETCWAINKRQDNELKNFLHQFGDLFELYDDAWTYKP